MSTCPADDARDHIHIRMSNLYGECHRCQMPPHQIIHHRDSRISYKWFVDFDEDRFIEVTSSIKSLDILAIYRKERDAEAEVIVEIFKLVDWIRAHLVRLSTD
jgi:hypothetical protein